MRKFGFPSSKQLNWIIIQRHLTRWWHFNVCSNHSFSAPLITMNKNYRDAFLVLACSMFCAMPLANAAEDPVSLADPKVGTAPNNGTQYPGAALPFSLVKLSPDTNNPWTAGYHPDEPIVGFSHTHISGTSSTAFAGQILIRPQSGELDVTMPPSPKKDETAAPGFYSVKLTRDQVLAELTLTPRSGVHRYTFESGKPRRVLVDFSATLNNSKKPEPSSICTGSQARFVSDTEIEGDAGFIGGYTKFAYRIYFVARFEQKPIARGGWLNSAASPDALKAEGAKGQKAGLYAEFSPETNTVGLRVGISYTSVENARRNLMQSDGQSFDDVKKNAQQAWRSHFNRIQVEGGTDNQRRQFYTAMYHSVLTPTDATGDQGPWPTNEPAFWDIYTVWDTFRSSYPYQALLYPKEHARLIRSFLDVYKQTGWLRDGWAYQKTGFALQGGTNADVVIADAIVKNLGGFDKKLAYEAVKKNSTVPAEKKLYPSFGRHAPYLTMGYVPAEYAFDEKDPVKRNEYGNPVSTSLEYAYNDFAVAQVAEAMGEKEDAKRFRERSLKIYDIFNPETGFFWGKKTDGSWVPGFDPTRDARGIYSLFYEGTAWQYRFSVPHDVNGVITRLGGNQKFVATLDEFFDKKLDWIGNEPGFLTPWLYVYAGQPAKTADRIRHLLNKEFRVSPKGYPGDEDNGAMSSWYIFGAMGFYPNAGQDVYLLGSPIFSKISMQLGDSGKKFVIDAQGLSEANRYVQSATLNGKKWEKAWFQHADIINGATLVLKMGPEPSKWGSTNPPPSLSTSK
jgi:predicted alpha-1,2-mannosidase